MDYELEHRIKFEYQLEQLSQAFSNRYNEERQYTVKLNINSSTSGNTSLLNLILLNDITVISIQFDLILPNNVYISSLNPNNRASHFDVTNTDVVNGMTRVIMSTDNLDGIIAGDDTVLYINLFSPMGYNISNKTIIIKNISITAAEPVSYDKDDVNIKL